MTTNINNQKIAKSTDNRFSVLLLDVMKEGGLNITGFKNCGKTNAMQVLTSEAMKLPNVTVYIFDDCGNWRHYFDTIRFIEVTDDFVTETDTHLELSSDVFVRYEKGYTVTHADELDQLINDKQHTLFDLSIKDIDRQGFFCYSIIQKIYDIQRIQKKHYGMDLPHSYIIITEEMQNLWEATNKRCFNRMRKIFSTARNFKISFIGSMQRLADVQTKIIERQNYLFGKTIGDNDTLKVGRILRNHEEQRKALESAETGTFLYYNGFKAEIVKFPKFQQNGKPYLWHKKIEPPTQQPQKRLSFFAKLFQHFKPKIQEESPEYKAWKAKNRKTDNEETEQQPPPQSASVSEESEQQEQNEDDNEQSQLDDTMTDGDDDLFPEEF